MQITIIAPHAERPPDATDSDIGTYVRQTRTEHRLTLAMVADVVGISVPYLSDIERGVKDPPVRLWQAIGAAVGADMERLKRKYRLEAARRATEAWERNT